MSQSTCIAPVDFDARRNAWAALALLVPLPCISVWASLYASPGPVGMAVFAVAKVWILVMPILWTLRIERVRPGLPRLRGDGLGPALVIGALTMIAIACGYWFLARGWIDASTVRSLARHNGLNTPMVYFIAAALWCVVNSLLEEYVWRWFVFRQCAALLPGRGGWGAAALSSLLFTLHHTLALAAQFDWRVTVIGSLGVFVGGVMWAGLYRRFGSIWPGYLAHIMADMPIFLIGGAMIFGQPHASA